MHTLKAFYKRSLEMERFFYFNVKKEEKT